MPTSAYFHKLAAIYLGGYCMGELYYTRVMCDIVAAE